MTRTITFSRDDVAQALQSFARKLGENHNIGKLVAILPDDDDPDFCKVQLDSLERGIYWRQFARSYICAALLNDCLLRDIELPIGPKTLAFGEDDEIALQIGSGDPPSVP